MTLREEILEATEIDGVKSYSAEDKAAVDRVFDNLVTYFNSIGRADAASVLRNLKNRHIGIKTGYLGKMADMIKQYRNF